MVLVRTILLHTAEASILPGVQNQQVRALWPVTVVWEWSWDTRLLCEGSLRSFVVWGISEIVCCTTLRSYDMRRRIHVCHMIEIVCCTILRYTCGDDVGSASSSSYEMHVSSSSYCTLRYTCGDNVDRCMLRLLVFFYTLSNFVGSCG